MNRLNPRYKFGIWHGMRKATLQNVSLELGVREV